MENNVNEATSLLVQETSKTQRFREVFVHYKLEFAMLFVFFGWNLSSSIVPNILLKNACMMYGYNLTICDDVNNYTKEIEEKIQPFVAEIILTSTLLHTIIPAIFSLFLGPWSDKFGRKKVICGTLIGASLSMATFTVVSTVSDHLTFVNPWIFVLPNIPIIMAGGWPSMISAIFCYITDVTNEIDRSSRLISFETVIFLGMFTASAACSFVLQLTSTTTMFLISTTLVSSASIFIIISVNESLPAILENESAVHKIQEIFSLKPIKEMLITCFKPRPDNGRKILWCLLMILILTTIINMGFDNVFYLFARQKFQWTLRDLTLYSSTLMILAILGNCIGVVVFKKLLKLSDLSLIFIAISSKILDSTSKVFVQTTLQMYITSGMFFFKVLTPIMSKSLISTLVANNEIGKIFCIIASIEALSSLIASPIYTFVYTQTFTFFPAAFYLISLFISLIIICIAFYVKKIINVV